MEILTAFFVGKKKPWRKFVQSREFQDSFGGGFTCFFYFYPETLGFHDPNLMFAYFSFMG